MTELRMLAGAVARQIRETLQAAHSAAAHTDMLEALGDLEKALEQKDEAEALSDLIALSEALDLSIPDAELDQVEVVDDAELDEQTDDDEEENTQG